MAKLILEKGEHTVDTLLAFLIKMYKSKTNGLPFSKADIHDWTNKGKVPKHYGGQYIRSQKLGPLKVLELSLVPFIDNTQTFIKIEKA